MRIASFKTKTYCFGQSPKFVLWVQGCRNSCSGCIAPEWQDTTGGQEKSIDEIMVLIFNNNIEGVVISGGEPLLQYKELSLLMRLIHAKKTGIIIYTGYDIENVNKNFSQILKFADIIISGPYIEKYNNGRGLRGSTNQEITFLSERYETEREYFESGQRMLEIDIKNDSLLFCGIPPLDSEALMGRISESTKKLY